MTIYVVPDLDGEERLVDAPNKAHAERHVSEPIKARIATQQDLVRLLANDVPIEQAKAEGPRGGGGGGGRPDQQLGTDAE